MAKGVLQLHTPTNEPLLIVAHNVIHVSTDPANRVTVYFVGGSSVFVKEKWTEVETRLIQALV
jgi:hypothetical protein